MRLPNFGIASLLFALITLTLKSCIINNPQPEECVAVKARIVQIDERSGFDIFLLDDGGDYYYINRGAERGLTVEGLKKKLLNKEATMHLPKFVLGTSEHIAQLSIAGDTIFTEFD